MKVVVWRSPKAFSGILRILFGIKNRILQLTDKIVKFNIVFKSVGLCRRIYFCIKRVIAKYSFFLI